MPYGVETSNQFIVLSTFVTEPFLSFIESDDLEFDPTDFETLNKADPAIVENIDYFYQCFFGMVPVTEEFFTEAESIYLDEIPPGTAPWLFLPMYETIDLSAFSAGDKVAFTLEGFFNELLDKYVYQPTTDDEAETYCLLSPFNTYTDEEGNKYYGPLPLRFSYSLNEEYGIEIQ